MSKLFLLVLYPAVEGGNKLFLNYEGDPTNIAAFYF